MRIRSIAASALLVAITLLAAACSDSSTAASSVSSVAVTGTAPIVGATSQFAATATMSNGTTQDVTSVATWSSSNTAAAAVSASGLVTGTGSGSAVISASYSNVTGTDSITVP